MSEWHVVETAPSDGTRLQVTGVGEDGVERLAIGHWNKAAGRFLDDVGYPLGFQPSHWQPLPAYLVTP